MPAAVQGMCIVPATIASKRTTLRCRQPEVGKRMMAMDMRGPQATLFVALRLLSSMSMCQWFTVPCVNQ
jgi:hypothetical protein